MPPEAEKEKAATEEQAAPTEKKQYGLGFVLIVAGAAVALAGAGAYALAVITFSPADTAEGGGPISPNEMVDLEDGFKSVKKHYDPATNREVRRQVSMKIHLEVHPSDTAKNRDLLEKSKPIIKHKVGDMLDRKSWADVQALEFRNNFATEIREALNRDFGTKAIKNVWLELELN